MRTSFGYIHLLLCLLTGLTPTLLTGQTTGCPFIRLVDVELNEATGHLDFKILALDEDCLDNVELQTGDLIIKEDIENDAILPVRVLDVVEAPFYEKVDMRKDTVQILFLSERSTVMTDADLVNQQEIVESFVAEYESQLGLNARFWLGTIGRDPGDFEGGSKQKFIGAFNDLNQIEAPRDLPDLYRSIISNLNRLDQRPGRKLVFLLASGEHQTNQSRYADDGPKIPPTLDNALYSIQSFGSNLHFFPILIGSGANDEVLQQMADATPDPTEELEYGDLPRSGINEVIRNQSRLLYTHRVSGGTISPTFQGERREYSLYTNISVDPSTRLFRAGSFANPKFASIQNQGDERYLVYTGGGLVVVLLLLGLFAVIFPMIRQWRFRSKHVIAYVPQRGRAIMDPITREPIKEGELVVNVCKVPTPLASWRDCDYQCPHYPNCTKNNLQCKGEGAKENQAFFRATGINRTLNWIWFGALGGLAGWLIFAIIDWTLQGGTGGLGVYADQIMNRYTEGASSDSLVQDVIIGASFGTGLILLLSIMEERSQSRKFSYGRIVLRTTIGTIVSLLIFGGGFLLQATGVITYPLLAASLTWLVFGLGIGVVLMINSSISNVRGTVGGMLAGLIGFAVYWFVGSQADDFLLAKVTSLILTGGVLGGVLDTVIHLAEDYQMEYVTPVEYSRNRIPLSKWLKSGWEIIIGTQPGSQVYIKWPDPNVEPEHAKITLEGGRVFLIPYGETLVNGRINSGQKKIQLHDGDLIKLGRDSITEMRFHEKQKVMGAE